MEQETLIQTEAPVRERRLYIESYGCAMNFSDSEIVATIMQENGFRPTTEEHEADVIFLNTCAIRDNAEQRIRERLKHLRGNKKRKGDLIIGVLGCMAERLKEKLLEEEKLVDVVAGPDAYRELPILINEVEDGRRSINVLLSLEETYADIAPTRLNSNGVSAFISIMRGCDNMCSFCVVPFTRGRERSRDPQSIVQEALALRHEGFREITLLGQNVDSYLWFGGGPKKEYRQLSEEEKASAVDFADLLEMTAQAVPDMRIRYSTSHPRDITEKVVHTMARHRNICHYIHLPAQSGNDRILDLMNRNYTREWYMDKVRMIREILPDCGISCDIISGFCTETEEEHQDTLSLMEWAQFDFSYMYKYSERPGTLAARKYADDIPEETKIRRLQEIIELQNRISREKNQQFIGKEVVVLVEGRSKRSDNDWMGKNDQHIVTIFPKEHYKPGDLVRVRVEKASTTTLIGTALGYAEF
ncbi:MAG: tRNA (N6-isopentenyl adenosine(37)-C2)-methylthiotransferase MiaB [Bacteroidota bacterium]|jgi:tRNA-2-methylthio-N6-dimethylallyladenosine synthase